MKVMNKELLDSSNQYYEPVGSPTIDEHIGSIKINGINLKPLNGFKKHSSRNLIVRLDDKDDAPLKSERSVRNRIDRDSILLSVGDLGIHNNEDEFVQKMKSNEIHLVDQTDDLVRKSKDTTVKSILSGGYSIEEEDIKDQLNLSGTLEYIEEVDSPVSSETESYDDFFKRTDIEESETEDIDDEKAYQSLREEEKKLFSADSQYSYRSNEFDFVNQNRRGVLSSDRSNEPHSLRMWGSNKMNDRSLFPQKHIGSKLLFLAV